MVRYGMIRLITSIFTYLCRNTPYKEQKIAVISCLKNIKTTEIQNLTYHSPTLIDNLLSKQHTYLPQE